MSPERQILQRHIEDTIDRLHGHALQINRAGAGHRRERVKLYPQKPEPGHAYKAYETLARLKAKDQFPKAEDELVSRMVSFARRRTRFDYLKEHQKKRAVESHHVFQDFEPYFCLFKDCDDPFGVPNTFDGLLGHMQTHVEERFHLDMPDGKHREFTEQEFEDYLTQRNDISPGDLQTLKESARHKGIFLFKECPFCGGYPDDVEKSCKDPNTAEAQIKLRQHIKRHLQDIALFLPPYREDVFQEDENSDSSNFSRWTAGFRNAEHLDENLTVCGNDDCDCKDLTKNSQDLPETMSFLDTLKDAEVSYQNSELAEPWEALFPKSSRYSKSDLTEKDCLDD
ncbi:hypothetical protein CPLU01_15508 [Colletotrichum plurivorum]|uniref:C2H2-type domain-containing protein n=1 Tax=Colletotrichum plurivorum TaxID=2175906 RepID=A0A8H6JAB7_9PEZI|nr:hypothetical protein CPLU01_15508 [Colletotrichum plurivorum]